MKACGVEGTNQGLVTIYKTFTSQYKHYIYIVSRSRNMMQHLLEPFSFNNKFLHSSESRCVCIYIK